MSQTPSRYYEAQVGVLGSMLIDGAHTAGLVMQGIYSAIRFEPRSVMHRSIGQVLKELSKK